MSKPPRNSANDPADDTSNSPTAMPILVALGIVGVVLVVMVLLRMIGGEDVSAEGAVGRAVVGQNDALQREDYADFRRRRRRRRRRRAGYRNRGLPLRGIR